MISDIIAFIPQFLQNYYTKREQSIAYKQQQADMGPHQALLQVDFSEILHVVTMMTFKVCTCTKTKSDFLQLLCGILLIQLCLCQIILSIQNIQYWQMFVKHQNSFYLFASQFENRYIGI